TDLEGAHVAPLGGRRAARARCTFEPRKGRHVVLVGKVTGVVEDRVVPQLSDVIEDLTHRASRVNKQVLEADLEDARVGTTDLAALKLAENGVDIKTRRDPKHTRKRQRGATRIARNVNDASLGKVLEDAREMRGVRRSLVAVAGTAVLG